MTRYPALSVMLTRRELLESVVAAGRFAGVAAAFTGMGFTKQSAQDDRGRTGVPNVALELAQFLNRTRFRDLPPKAIEHAKMSTNLAFDGLLSSPQ